MGNALVLLRDYSPRWCHSSSRRRRRNAATSALADLRADEELRCRVALAEERLADLKAALEDMRAQRVAWQEMAQAPTRPAPASSKSRCPVAESDQMMSGAPQYR